MSEQDFGTIEDGYGGCWARCKEDCCLEIVRPGKVQCNECDYKCNSCGGELKFFGLEDSPYERVSGYLCLPCTDAWCKRKRKKEDV